MSDQEKEILTIMNPSVTEAVDRIRDFDAHLFSPWVVRSMRERMGDGSQIRNIVFLQIML